jgi:hypothetical protein
MKRKFMKCVAGIAIAALAGGAARAATISANAAYYSLEGQRAYGSAGTTMLPELEITLGADYTLNDTITLAVAGASIESKSSATNLNRNAGTHATPANGVHCWAPARAGPPAAALLEDEVTISLVNITGNAITLRVTAKVQNTSSVGSICRVLGIDVTSPSLAALTQVTAAWNAVTANGGTAFDSSGTPTLIAQTEEQFVSDWGDPNAFGGSFDYPLTGIVDVASGDSWFFGSGHCGPSSGPADPGNCDITAWLAQDLSTGAADANGLAQAGNHYAAGSPIATLTSIVTTLRGTFTNLGYKTGECTYASATARGNFAESAGFPTSIANNCASISTTYANGAPGRTIVDYYTFYGYSGLPLIAPQTFSGEIVFNYSASVAGGTSAKGATTQPAANAGAWTLTGFQAHVSYMPISPDVSPIVYLTNKSARAGVATIVGYTESGTAFLANGIPVAARSVTALSNAVLAAVPAGYTGKVWFDVVVSVPANLAELYTGYNVGGRRNLVVNTSNGRVVQRANSTTGGSL